MQEKIVLDENGIVYQLTNGFVSIFLQHETLQSKKVKQLKSAAMKKNVLILAGLYLLGLFSWQAQAANMERFASINNFNVENDVPHGYDIIVLQGRLMFGINPNAIVAGASDDAIYIEFNQDFGNVNISIYNGMGNTVYSTMVDTSEQSVVIIPFTSAANGTYTVELSNADGDAEGDFDKN